eukprot:GHVO01033213.1.p1 GENE.GHVO01033213.1~~GHVO01033213.1.p1  ORF type:complete len:221 (+),score=24.93 GHVO01033213.1:155-817(+)
MTDENSRLIVVLRNTNTTILDGASRIQISEAYYWGNSLLAIVVSVIVISTACGGVCVMYLIHDKRGGTPFCLCCPGVRRRHISRVVGDAAILIEVERRPKNQPYLDPNEIDKFFPAVKYSDIEYEVVGFTSNNPKRSISIVPKFENLDNHNSLLCCVVCLADIVGDSEIRQLGCKHVFHKICIDQWFVKHVTCPICIRDVTPSSRPPSTPETIGRTTDEP